MYIGGFACDSRGVPRSICECLFKFKAEASFFEHYFHAFDEVCTGLS